MADHLAGKKHPHRGESSIGGDRNDIMFIFDPGQDERQGQRHDGGIHMSAFAHFSIGVQVGGLIKIDGKAAAAGVMIQSCREGSST